MALRESLLDKLAAYASRCSENEQFHLLTSLDVLRLRNQSLALCWLNVGQTDDPSCSFLIRTGHDAAAESAENSARTAECAHENVGCHAHQWLILSDYQLAYDRPAQADY